MPGQRLQRWPGIQAALKLSECLSACSMLSTRFYSVAEHGPEK